MLSWFLLLSLFAFLSCFRIEWPTCLLAQVRQNHSKQKAVCWCQERDLQMPSCCSWCPGSLVWPQLTFICECMGLHWLIWTRYLFSLFSSLLFPSFLFSFPSLPSSPILLSSPLIPFSLSSLIPFRAGFWAMSWLCPPHLPNWLELQLQACTAMLTFQLAFF